MRMTHVISEMSSFLTDRALSHDSTSLRFFSTDNILTDELSFCKQKRKLIEKIVFLFYPKEGIIANTYARAGYRRQFILHCPGRTVLLMIRAHSIIADDKNCYQFFDVDYSKHLPLWRYYERYN